MNWGHYLFGYSGRLNRAKYWLWVLLYMIASIVVTLIGLAAGDMVGGILQVIFAIVGFITALAVTAKRLHDRNKSAAWLLVFALLPTVLIIIAAIEVERRDAMNRPYPSPRSVDRTRSERWRIDVDDVPGGCDPPEPSRVGMTF